MKFIDWRFNIILIGFTNRQSTKPISKLRTIPANSELILSFEIGGT